MQQLPCNGHRLRRHASAWGAERRVLRGQRLIRHQASEHEPQNAVGNCHRAASQGTSVLASLPMRRTATLLLFAILTAILAVIGVPLQHPGLELDAAWQQALVEATEHQWVFGRDLIFTYGPLHQLATQQIATNLLPLLLGRVLYGIAWGATTALLGLLGGLTTALSLVVFISCTSTDNPASADALFNLLCILGVLCALAPLRRGSTARSSALWRLGQPALTSLQAMGIAIGTLIKLSYLGAALPALTAMAWCQIQIHRKRGFPASLLEIGRAHV